MKHKYCMHLKNIYIKIKKDKNWYKNNYIRVHHSQTNHNSYNNISK